MLVRPSARIRIGPHQHPTMRDDSITRDATPWSLDDQVIEWLPTSEDQLRDALDQGILTERHSLEFKRELPSGKSENKELARDLAQFVIDGGVLIIGVDDNAQLTPVDLHGLRERIDQVARDLIDEPLHVRVDTIPTAADPAKGYLLVTVPPSPTAPHQVDGRYYGRGDTTKHVLPDAEVQRLHQLALRRQRDAKELLDAEVARDPTSPEDWRQHAHLFLVAQPVIEQPNRLERMLGADGPKGWHDFLHDRVQLGPAGVPLNPSWTPDIPSINKVGRRARGWALSSDWIQPHRVASLEAGRPSTNVESRLLDLEINEDGGVRLFCARASDSRQTNIGQSEFAIEAVILGLTKRVVLIAGVIAATTRYLGSWDFGIAITRLRGCQSDRLRQEGLEGTPFSEDDYRQTVRVTHERLANEPDSIVEDLTGRLNRALGGTALVPRPPGEAPST